MGVDSCFCGIQRARFFVVQKYALRQIADFDRWARSKKKQLNENRIFNHKSEYIGRLIQTVTMPKRRPCTTTLANQGPHGSAARTYSMPSGFSARWKARRKSWSVGLPIRFVSLTKSTTKAFPASSPKYSSSCSARNSASLSTSTRPVWRLCS